jgi:hypothetical protein
MIQRFVLALFPQAPRETPREAAQVRSPWLRAITHRCSGTASQLQRYWRTCVGLERRQNRRKKQDDEDGWSNGCQRHLPFNLDAQNSRRYSALVEHGVMSASQKYPTAVAPLATSCRPHGVSTVLDGPCCAAWCDGSANWSGGPIAAGKRPNFYIRNDAALQARIEMAHGPLIEVDDAAGP